MSAGRPDSGGGSGRHRANASDIADSDSELEVAAHPDIFHPNKMPEAVKTYATFEEADAAAAAEAQADAELDAEAEGAYGNYAQAPGWMG